MKYTLPNGRAVNIPDKEIENSMRVLELTKEEAIQLWLEDNEYEINEEQAALDKTAKQVKIQHGATAEKKERKTPKERIVKVSDEKQALFSTILANLDRCELVERENITVLKENKLIQVQIGSKIFKVDIIEQRPPKK